MGANDAHTLRALIEAESYDGPSLIIAYSHCIAHGFDMTKGLEQQKLAVDSGHWPLYRYDPRLKLEGKNPFQLNSKPPKIRLQDYIYNEARYRMLTQSNPEAAAHLLSEAQKAVEERWRRYEQMASQ
jgi:pyruvate-ferredoxin/flavodoxin oxidoreductase